MLGVEHVVRVHSSEALHVVDHVRLVQAVARGLSNLKYWRLLLELLLVEELLCLEYFILRTKTQALPHHVLFLLSKVELLVLKVGSDIACLENLHPRLELVHLLHLHLSSSSLQDWS